MEYWELLEDMEYVEFAKLDFGIKMRHHLEKVINNMNCINDNKEREMLLAMVLRHLVDFVSLSKPAKEAAVRIAMKNILNK